MSPRRVLVATLAAGVLAGGCAAGGGEQPPPSSSAAPPTTTAAAAAPTTAVTPTPGPDGTFGDLVLAAGDFPVPLVAQPVTADELRSSLSAGGSAVVDPPGCAGASPTSPGALADLGYASATAASTGLVVREVVSTGTRSLAELDDVVRRCASSTATLGQAQTTTVITAVDPPAVAADGVRAYRLDLTARASGATQSRTVRALVAQLGPVQVVVTGDTGATGAELDAGVVDEVFGRAVAKVRGSA